MNESIGGLIWGFLWLERIKSDVRMGNQTASDEYREALKR